MLIRQLELVPKPQIIPRAFECTAIFGCYLH